ncbi:helix-turn-helix domain-containing protein [Lactococcus lactis]|uniref:helix-turn-helix domain-containing protein n=1 Tax=Lactococcus lactis TaxID=1358 RepID=UPI0024A909B6|nr:helix-turn-helix transcriptional regulator [Lactococcus lactis]
MDNRAKAIINKNQKSIFYNNVKAIAEKSEKSINQIERELGYPRNSINNYKKGREPSGVRLLELAEYFGVSPGYLIGKKEHSKTSPATVFEQLCNEQRLEMLKICHDWSENILNKNLG